jgi:hypothetical protein
MRMIFPSEAGLKPRSELRIAFSIGATIDLSHGSTTSNAGSGTLMLAACASGVGVP